MKLLWICVKTLEAYKYIITKTQKNKNKNFMNCMCNECQYNKLSMITKLIDALIKNQ